MVKKLCAAALAIVMTCSMSVGVYAVGGEDIKENITTVGKYEKIHIKYWSDFEYYTNDSGNITIYRYDGDEKNVIVPSKIDKKKVTIIGEDAFGATSIQNVKIPNSVTYIGNNAFNGCKNLKKIIIPNSVTGTGYNVFGYCTSLKSVKLGSSLKTIGDDAFYGCISLKSVYVPKTVKKLGIEAFGYRYNRNNELNQKKIKGFTIKCYKNSAAEKYAKENKLNYLIVDKKPSTPKISKASRSKTSVRLYFSKVYGISGYKIQQYDSKTKKWKDVGKSKVDLTNTSNNGYNYKIKGLKSGKSYKFRVMAYTSLSSKTLKSGWSKSFTVKTK